MAIADIIIGNRCRYDMGDIDALAKSICKIGLLNAVVITRDGALVAGARRIAACLLLGWTHIPVSIFEDE
jgi:ParB family chromosome partitioning protein